jgi:hypothetical protein
MEIAATTVATTATTVMVFSCWWLLISQVTECREDEAVSALAEEARLLG